MLGLSAVFALNTGSYGSPVYSGVTETRDLKLPADFKPADSSTRGMGGYATKEPTLTDLSVQGQLLYNPSDSTVFAALMAAAYGKTPVEVAVADGPIATSGTSYLRFTGKFGKWEKGEELENVQMVDFEFAPCQ